MKTESDKKLKFESEWREYRKRRNQYYLAFGLIPLYLIFIGIFDYLLTMILEKPSNYENVLSSLYFLIISSYFFLVLVTLARFNTWKCPNCNEQFFAFSFWVTSPTMMKNCENCKLPKFYGSSFYKGISNFIDWGTTKVK